MYNDNTLPFSETQPITAKTLYEASFRSEEIDAQTYYENDFISIEIEIL